jgi:ribonuclease Z
MCCFTPAAACAAVVDVAAVQDELRQEKPEVLEALAAATSAAAAAAAAGQQQGGDSAAAAPQGVPACVASGRRDELEVTFLGTGAAIPSKYRNVTGIHVNLFSRGGLLMDCGELSCLPG